MRPYKFIRGGGFLWDKLKEKTCPKRGCEGELKEKGHVYECPTCGFFITKARFEEINEQ